jgi:hypothetical protein
MFRDLCCRLIVALFIMLVGTLPHVAAASPPDYRVELSRADPPQELTAGVREALSPGPVRVLDANDAYCEVWLRKSIPTSETPNRNVGVAFGNIDEGTLVGAVRFEARVSDYHQQHIEPGIYTLRYMLIPVDAYHQGVAPDRDFLVLVPAALDLSPAKIPTADLLDLSRKASGTGHPAAWSILPGETAPETLPALSQRDDLCVLYLQIPLKRPTAMGLIVAGHAPVGAG